MFWIWVAGLAVAAFLVGAAVLANAGAEPETAGGHGHDHHGHH